MRAHSASAHRLDQCVSAGWRLCVHSTAGCALGHYRVQAEGLREDMWMAFEQILMIGWRDLDANGHRANTAYLDKSVDVRIAYMSSRGVTMAERPAVLGPCCEAMPVTMRPSLRASSSLRLAMGISPLETSMVELRASRSRSR